MWQMPAPLLHKQTVLCAQVVVARGGRGGRGNAAFRARPNRWGLCFCFAAAALAAVPLSQLAQAARARFRGRAVVSVDVHPQIKAQQDFMARAAHIQLLDSLILLPLLPQAGTARQRARHPRRAGAAAGRAQAAGRRGAGGAAQRGEEHPAARAVQRHAAGEQRAGVGGWVGPPCAQAKSNAQNVCVTPHL